MHHAFDSRWRVRALAGDANAVATLADATLAPLYRFCFHRVGNNHHLCEEIVQETLVRGIRQLEAYDPTRSDGRILPWLTGLARNEIRRVLAREKPTAPLTAIWERLDSELLEVYQRLESEPFSDASLEREETRDLVNATMSQLPIHYQEVLEAKYVLGQTVRAMANALDLTEKTVESRLTRARAAFRATFQALTQPLNVEAV